MLRHLGKVKWNRNRNFMCIPTTKSIFPEGMYLEGYQKYLLSLRNEASNSLWCFEKLRRKELIVGIEILQFEFISAPEQTASSLGLL